MKRAKVFYIIFILITILSCRQTNLTKTGPGDDFFLDKLANGNWDGVSVSGNTITITGVNGNDSYTLDGTIVGIGGIYKDDKNNGDYIIAVPDGSNLHTVKVDEEGKDAINGIIGIVGEENALGVITGIGTSNGNTNVDNVVKNANVTDKEKDKIQEYLDIINGKGEANSYEKYPSKK
ncbi:hypothetical protein WESB_0519 [Brachyspira pilosicoli WesB]|uniref:Lipoprotein n=1 Tax=Brachyspira pilosicoli WesB TaxID=1161918 RepID=K0JGP1_BRAPL|nr:hypothetical protein [Brachyspira pilosicoli]CCG55989.1 hypothetical protein WESB_0519 [Brachyspira pilosicoli WesB]